MTDKTILIIIFDQPSTLPQSINTIEANFSSVDASSWNNTRQMYKSPTR